MGARQFPTRVIGTALTEVQYGLSLAASAKGNYPIVGMKDIRDGRIHVDESIRVDLDDEAAERFLLQPGDVLLNRTNSNELVGKCAIYDMGTPAVFASYLVRLKFDEKKLLPAFANYFLNSEYGQSQLKVLSTRGVSQANINPTTFRKHFSIPFPKLDEQRRIVHVLDAADRLIRGELKRASQLRQLRSAVIARTTKQATSSKAKKFALSELADVRMSGVDKKTVEGESNVLLCNYMDVFYNETINSWINFMHASATVTEIERFTLERGDVLLTKDSEVADEIAACAVVDTDLPGVLCGYHLALLRPNEKRVLGHYLAIALRDPHVRHQFARCANGVTRFGLTLDAFDQVEIALPTLKAQQKMADAYATISMRIEASRRLSEQLVEQKRGLMQQLITGQQRLTRDLPGMKPGHV